MSDDIISGTTHLTPVDAETRKLIVLRELARNRRDWETADPIQAQLRQMGMSDDAINAQPKVQFSELEPEVQEMLVERSQARSDRNYGRADELKAKVPFLRSVSQFKVA